MTQLLQLVSRTSKHLNVLSAYSYSVASLKEPHHQCCDFISSLPRTNTSSYKCFHLSQEIPKYWSGCQVSKERRARVDIIPRPLTSRLRVDIGDYRTRKFYTLCLKPGHPEILPVIQNQVLIGRCLASEQKENYRWNKKKWSVYFISTLLGLFAASLGYFQYRRYSFKKRGVNLVSVPNASLQAVFPFGWYKGIFISTALLDNIENAEHFKVRKNDVFVISFPRSGTTWTQELVYLIANDGNIAEVKSRCLEERFPYLEDHTRPIDELNERPSPRFIKSHIPYRLLPKGIHEEKPKIIYVMRNPKDAVVSFYHFWQKLRAKYRGTFEDFCEQFFRDELVFAPWLEHVRGFWERREQDNILFLKYEDMQKDLPSEVRRIAEFLGKTLTDKQVGCIVEHCSFDSMKQNDMVNYQWWDKAGLTSNMGTSFMRKGKVGDWKNYFTPELDARMNEKIERTLRDIGLEVDYEINTRE